MLECYLVIDYEYAQRHNESQKTEQEYILFRLCEFLE